MKTRINTRHRKFIITYFLLFLIIVYSPFVSYAQTQDKENYTEASTFDEFISAATQLQSTGGTVVLTDDITLPAGESYIYNNGRYRKEVIVETNGHTIYVEGYLSLWPFLTIKGDGSQKELLHISPGGELRIVSICIDAGETGTAIIQEEGSFLMYGSETDLGLPEFSCIGKIITPRTITAAACWNYNSEKLPVVRVPEGSDFFAEILPDTVLSIVNRDHQEYEEDVPVVWDEATFPTEHKRTLVQGKFADGYSQYGDNMPMCLVVWESETSPYFLNVYLKSATQWYDMIFMYGESTQPGTIYIQSSDDGEKWTNIDGTEGYEPIKTYGSSDFIWMLTYDKTLPAVKIPKYYRMMQILENGTEVYSDALELSDKFIFTAADIEGGRGGETSPNEGENQLPNDILETDNTDETAQASYPDSPYHQESILGSDNFEQPKNETDKPEDSSSFEHTEESFNDNNSSEADSTFMANNAIDNEKTEETKLVNNTSGAEITIGILILICILLASVTLSVLMKKKK